MHTIYLRQFHVKDPSCFKRFIQYGEMNHSGGVIGEGDT